MIVRALHLSFSVPDHDGGWATLYYPADDARITDARLTGAVAADQSDAPWPIVIIMPGINVAPDGYRWLAVRLVEAGFAAVTYSTIGSLGPAGQGITPGIDMSALAPDVMGTQPSAAAIDPLLMALNDLSGTPTDGLLDFDQIILTGHSAGGTVALHNSRSDWVRGLKAVVGYGAHTMTATALGHAEASVATIAAEVPVLLLGAAHDAVIEQSRDRYTDGDGDHDPIGRTFAEAIDRNLGDTWRVELTKANHFTMCHPVDETSGRSFLESDLRADDLATRALLAEVIVAFLDDTINGAAALEHVVTQPGVHRWDRR